MMSSIFDKFDKALNAEAIAKEVKEMAESGTASQEKLPHGIYEVKLGKLEIVECKSEKHKGEPLLKGSFKVIAGANKGKWINMNQLIVMPFQIHLMNEFLKSLDTGVEVTFKSYSQYADMLKDIEEACEKLEFVLDFTEEKGFDKFKITEVFEI